MARTKRSAAIPGRAGRYVLQPAGYKAFIPAALPPEPPFEFDIEMQQLLSQADRALGRLDGSIQTLPDPNHFIAMYVKKEAVLSSQIEGTQASLDDVIRAEADIAADKGDVGEVINYIAAMNHGLKRLDTIPLSRRLICEIHDRLLRGVRGNAAQPGEVRRSQNWIGPSGSKLANAIFVPPPPDVVDKAFGDVEKYWHAGDAMPPLVKIGLIHAQFETIHPFLDGNGRIGRLLIAFFLVNKQLLQSPVLYLSIFLKQHRSEYYRCLQAVRDEGDWEGWIKFFLQGVASAAGHATETARKIVELRESHRALVAESFSNHAGKGALLLERLYRRPTASVNDVKEMLGISYPNANALLQKFVDNKLLFEMTGQARNRVFIYAPYVVLFSDA
jgi:Fic family protein